jgi:hypothetical protein
MVYRVILPTSTGSIRRQVRDPAARAGPSAWATAG